MRFAGARERGSITIVGVPYEGVISGLPGAKEGPYHVRKASYLLETYVPELGVDVRDVQLADMGDVEPFGCPKKAAKEVEEVVTGVRYPVIIGGDHSITVGAVRALKKRYGELRVLYLDAHLDLREEYGGSAHSHACTAARIAETGAHISFFGVRSGTREEWAGAEEMDVRRAGERWPTEFREPVYITVDMDVFDPAFAPGVGTPEPAGITPAEFFSWLHNIDAEIVGVDVVETNPLVEGNITPVLAAKVVRNAVAKMWLSGVQGKGAPWKNI